MIKFLAEDKKYKVYSLCESVYLKHKSYSTKQDAFDQADSLITAHYGDPTAAIIIDGKHIIVSGCGLTIFDIIQNTETNIFSEPDNTRWTDGLHQGFEDGPLEFRFISQFETDKLRVFRMNILTKEVTMLN